MKKETAQELIQVIKRILKTGTYYLPPIGEQNQIKLQSVQSPRDKFIVYVNRASRIVSNKYTLLLRYPEEGLLRIDVNGPDHVNPDGSRIPCPHIHMRMDDTGKWDAYAFELPAIFGDTDDCISTLQSFLQYCHTNNITELMICEQKEVMNYESTD